MAAKKPKTPKPKKPALPPAEEQRAIHPPHGGTLIPFRPGQSGNPSGRSGLYGECQMLARKASPDAMKRMIELMNSEDERVALMASDKVYERAWGKAKEMDPNASDPARPNLGSLDPKDLKELRRIMAKMASAARTADGGPIVEGDAQEVE